MIKGDVLSDYKSRNIYSTDASAYQELPQAVLIPRDERDVELIVGYAHQHKLPIIPRAAGTSLAGQVVGNGLVVDVSKHLNRILKLNIEERWVEVEPGVVLDELNLYLKPHNLFFGPETSTSNRCNIGGMVGNNSCGSRSLVYGSTRDHLLAVEGFLSNGQRVCFGELDVQAFILKLKSESLEGDIYRKFNELLGDPKARHFIKNEFPHEDIKRRNTGYAVDLLVDMKPWGSGKNFNMCSLIAGSEGTLMFITKIRLALIPLPPPNYGLLCVHFQSLADAFNANMLALKFKPTAVELMDKTILDLTRENITQRKNRFFVDGDPEALLLVELNDASIEAVSERAGKLVNCLKENGLGYAYPLLFNSDIAKVWALRKAGLGVLSNMPGNDLPVPVIEDTAVRVDDLNLYLSDIGKMLLNNGKSCVYYGHIGSGELHLRPVLNMKQKEDVALFRKIAEETAVIVKKYRGSLSGEHGDGRLRGEFIPYMIGEFNFDLLKQIKQVFDPYNIFNPGKIIDAPPMDTHLRYSKVEKSLFTSFLKWDQTGGLLQGAEKCNGSADCRKNMVMGGAMCPSFMATRNEADSTRARANLLRLYLTGQLAATDKGLRDVKEILDLCLMCKACKAECPSNIDVAKLKMEFMQHYGDKVGFALRDFVFANQPVISKIASSLPIFFNGLIQSSMIRFILDKWLGISAKTHLPRYAHETLMHYNEKRHFNEDGKPIVWLFADEFTSYNNVSLGITTILLLERLGYNVRIPQHIESGRTYLSKGMLHKAKRVANRNVQLLSDLVNNNAPLIGVEPSAILTLRDEYPDLVDDVFALPANSLAENTFTIEEFLWKEMKDGRISQSQFTDEPRTIHFHGHCYQKALSDTNYTKLILSFPKNYNVLEIKSGCCGMAGSFGLEKEHVSLSVKIGEMALFPHVRSHATSSDIVVSGISCKHHVENNTGCSTSHPVEILYKALILK